LKIYVFVAEMKDEFILCLDVGGLGAPYAATGPRKIFLWRPGARLQSSRLTLASDEVIPAGCLKVVSARREDPSEAANGLAESELTTSHSVDTSSSSAEDSSPIREYELKRPGSCWRHHLVSLGTSHAEDTDR
jgi:hypothetical protein